MKNRSWFWLGMVSLFLTIVTLVITITINAYPLYVLEIKQLDLAESLGLTSKQLLLNYREMMGYLNFPWRNQFKLTDFPHSVSGAFHFYEVKRLFMLNYGVLLITITPTVLFLRKLWREGQFWRLVRPFQIAALIPIAFGLVMLMSFDWFFVTFHSIFFNNDAWLFNPLTDPIINALPESYFMHCFVLGFLLFELLLLLGIYLGKYQLLNKNKKEL